MAAPSFVAVGSQASGLTGSVSYPLPAGIADGDTLIAGIESAATGGVTTSTPGWADVAGSPRAQGSNTLAVNALIDTYASGDGNLVGAGSNNHQTGAIAAFRGVGGVDATSNNSGNSASPTGLGITTTVDECRVVLVAVYGADTATAQFSNVANTSLTGVTVHYQAGTTNGNGGGLLIASGVKATAGSVSAWTADLAASQTWAALVIALAPAAGTAPVTAGRETTWNTLAAAAVDRLTSWATRALASTAVATVWDVRTQVAAQRSSTWNVDGAITQVTAVRATSWRTPAPVTTTRSSTWRALTLAATIRNANWDTRTQVTATRSTSWDTRSSVTVTRPTSWDAVASVIRALATAWDVRRQVTTQRSSTWNVDSTIAAATAERATIWRTLVRPTAARTSTWDTRTVVTNTRPAAWDVRAAVTLARTTTWRALAHAAATRSAAWDTCELTTGTRSTSWRVQSELPEPAPPRLTVDAPRPGRYARGAGRPATGLIAGDGRTAIGLTAGAPRTRYQAGDPR